MIWRYTLQGLSTLVYCKCSLTKTTSVHKCWCFLLSKIVFGETFLHDHMSIHSSCTHTKSIYYLFLFILLFLLLWPMTIGRLGKSGLHDESVSAHFVRFWAANEHAHDYEMTNQQVRNYTSHRALWFLKRSRIRGGCGQLAMVPIFPWQCTCHDPCKPGSSDLSTLHLTTDLSNILFDMRSRLATQSNKALPVLLWTVVACGVEG